MILRATPPQPPPPDRFAKLCAYCWKRRATRVLRSRGGWNVGVCVKCYSRLAAEPFLRPVGNGETRPVPIEFDDDGTQLLPYMQGETPPGWPTLDVDQDESKDNQP